MHNFERVKIQLWYLCWDLCKSIFMLYPQEIMANTNESEVRITIVS